MHSLMDSLTHSIYHSIYHLLTHSLIQSITHSLNQSINHLPAYSYSLSLSLMHSRVPKWNIHSEVKRFKHTETLIGQVKPHEVKQNFLKRDFVQ